MKIRYMTSLLALGLVLSGCNQQPASQSQSQTHSAVQSAAKQKPAKTAAVKPKTVKLAWNEAKADKLNNFMQQFGPSMHQVYVKVDADTHSQWQGDDLSAIISAGKPVNLNGTTTKVTWLPAKDAGSKSRPNIVAIYADNTDKILYLFALAANGTTQAWVSQTEADDQVLTVKETANKDVSGAFSAIAKGAALRIVIDKRTQADSSSKPQTSSSAPSHVKPIFGPEYRHTWYSYDHAGDGSKLQQLSFTANAINVNGTTEPVYSSDMHTAADKKIMDDPASATRAKLSRQNWGSAGTFSKDGTQWIDIRGWYQTAGDGEYYRIVNRNLGGHTTPVLETADGAEIWHDANFYLDKADAQKYANKVFSDENGQNSGD